MDVAPLFILVLPVLTVAAVGLLGRTRRIGFWGAILISVLLTPLVGFIVTMWSGPKRRDKAKDKKK